MGQKVNPHGLRVGVIKDWDSRWYARADKVGDLIVEDYNIRKYLKNLLYSAGVPKIEIERDSQKVRIFIHCSRPGVVIGKGGAEIERLRAEVEKMIGKQVAISIVEVKSPDTNAQLIAEGIAQKLEKRIGFRRAMKNAMGRAMRLGVRGIKVMVAGRLGGAEIARDETYHEGTIPLQTIRADIEYGFAEAATTYGRIGVKVWVYNGEILSQTLRTTPRTMDPTRPPRERRERRDNRDNRGGNRSGGYNNRGGQGQGGGYNRPPGQGQGQGGYNRGGQGGYNNNRPQGQGGYNRPPGQQGSFNRAPSQGGARPPSAAQPSSPKAAETPSQEG
ncbi:MAG: 30S ribosomal protein S3 [Oscillospiraceae bacterium]|nr:30S ribosomal protein S3 [Oscillospiraceae bacterium]